MHYAVDLKLKWVLKLFCIFANNEILYAGYYFIKILCAAKPRKIFGVQNCSHEKMFAPNVRTLGNGVRTYFLIAPNFVRTHGLRFRPPCRGCKYSDPKSQACQSVTIARAMVIICNVCLELRGRHAIPTARTWFAVQVLWWPQAQEGTPVHAIWPCLAVQAMCYRESIV